MKIPCGMAIVASGVVVAGIAAAQPAPPVAADTAATNSIGDREVQRLRTHVEMLKHPVEIARTHPRTAATSSRCSPSWSGTSSSSPTR